MHRLELTLASISVRVDPSERLPSSTITMDRSITRLEKLGFDEEMDSLDDIRNKAQSCR